LRKGVRWPGPRLHRRSGSDSLFVLPSAFEVHRDSAQRFPLPAKPSRDEACSSVKTDFAIETGHHAWVAGPRAARPRRYTDPTDLLEPSSTWQANPDSAIPLVGGSSLLGGTTQLLSTRNPITPGAARPCAGRWYIVFYIRTHNTTMFIGHYAPALAAKALRNSPSLVVCFVAVQLVDIGFFSLAYFASRSGASIRPYPASCPSIFTTCRSHTALYGRRPFAKTILACWRDEVSAAVLYPALNASRSLQALMEFAKNVLICSGRLKGARLCSGLRSCGPTCPAIIRESTSATVKFISLLLCRPLCGLHAHVMPIVAPVVGQNRPDGTRNLVR